MRFKVIFLLLLSAFVLLPFASSAQLTDDGISKYRNENYEEALELFQKADISESSGRNSYFIGLSLKQIGRPKEALEYFIRAVAANPSEKQAAVEIIAISIANGSDSEALRWIEWCEKDKVSPAETAFLKGELFLHKGNPEAAINSFILAKQANPLLAQQADLQIAQAKIRLNDTVGAKESLRSVIAINPDNELAGFAREYELRLSTTAALKPWRVILGVNYQYDDNAVVDPSAYIPALRLPKRNDGSSSQALRILYDLPSDSPWLLSGQYTFYNNSYFHLDDYSPLAHTLSLTPGYRFPVGAITLPLTYNYSLLGYERYLYQVSARPTLTFTLSPEHIAQFSAGYSKREFFRPDLVAEERRDADIYSALLGYLFLFDAGRGFFNLRYEMSYEDTKGENWQAFGNKLMADLLMPLDKKTNLIITGEIGRQNFPLNSLYNCKRNDNLFSTSVTFSREIAETLFFNLQYYHATTDSNIPLYTFDRNVYLTGFEVRF